MNPNTQKSDAASDTRKRTAPRTPAFDTLRAVKKLKNAEFGDKQAVTLVETFQDAQSELATKADLERTELVMRGDLEKMELALRTDMEKMEAGIRHDMERMELNIRADMHAELKKLYWYIPLVVGVIASILGTFASLQIS